MADEASFISLIVAQARVDQLMKYALDNAYPGRQLQSMHELTQLVKSEETVQEAARDSHMARTLTTLLASTTDCELLDAISALLAALSGSGVHTSRLIDVRYSAGTVVKVSECALREGVGSRLWGISHTFNLFLMKELPHVVDGASVLELGSGVGSTGVVVAKMGAREVTVTDLTEPLLANLLVTVRANFAQVAEYSRTAVNRPGEVQRDDQAVEDLSFSDVDTVSNEEELFCSDDALEDGSKPHSEVDGVIIGQPTRKSCDLWDIANVRVRALDWKLENDRYTALHRQASPEHRITACGGSPGMEEDETTSALDYLQVYDAFDQNLKAMGLQYNWKPIHAVPGYSGLGNKEATYEGGYRLYSIKHS